ncbi:MAG TPA: type II toxin-antitoxin system death-on-curing family toxin [Candidatus Hydrogenedentes bacterium]|nr:type II toxin-antitoxin system death-on-curing family toxin [Candidatus Hydrogenedentota bacterium]
MIAWLSAEFVAVMHDELIAEHGGPSGIRDAGLLASAVARPRNPRAYEKAGLYRMAAAYGFGIAINHPFVDGNKRTALMAMYVFLRLNGLTLTAPGEETVHTMLRLADGDLTVDQLAAWLRENVSEAP